MHELGIVFNIIKTVEQVAEENDLDSVRSVTLELGQVSGVVTSQLCSCWKWAVDRTDILKGADLDIEEISAISFCEFCERTYDTVKNGKVCPHCKSGQTYLIQGNEMNIRDIIAE